jgi:transcriptional regulator with XRE-family HTH domain
VATIKISGLLSDEVILVELGKRIARYRLDRQLTQADIAEQAGISKRTLERIEAGSSAQMSSIIRILRVLDLFAGLDRLIPAPEPRPMDLLKRKGKIRQRASSRRHSNQVNEPWVWNDDK